MSLPSPGTARRAALTLLLGATALSACKPPPPAPEGLDDASSFVVRNFYADDATFQAGIQGFMDWFNAEGIDLVGMSATVDDTEAFSVSDLTAADVAHLPLDAQIVDDPGSSDDTSDDVLVDRDPTAAGGVVSLAEMDCTWIETEDYLVRPDQNAVFAGDWEAYERDYVTSRATFQDASAAGTFTRINQPLDPFAEDFDAERYADVLLLTDNMADPSPVLFADLDAYPLDLDLRHGIFEIDGEQVGVNAILTYNREAVWGPGGNNGLVQSYSVELNVQRPGDRTLRMLAVWAEPRGSGVDPEGGLVLSYAVNKSLQSSERMSDICAGTIELE